MYDKYEKYKQIKNDRSLIDKIPNEEELIKFEEWKKNVTRHRLVDCIVYGIMISFIAFVLMLMVLECHTIIKESIYFFIMPIIGFYIWTIIIIKGYLGSRAWGIEFCNSGKVQDKYSMRIARNLSMYYIIVIVDDKLLKIRTQSGGDWPSLKINDEVIVFSIKGQDLDVMKK